MSVGWARARRSCDKLAHVAGGTNDPKVRYFAGDWSADEYAEIRRELERRGVQYVIDGDELCVDREHERMLDMLVESVTEE
jgi:hypothetical protein